MAPSSVPTLFACVRACVARGRALAWCVCATQLHLAEVGDCTVLRRLLALLPEDHGYAPYLTTSADSFTGQHVALLTRVDPLEPLAFFGDASAPYPVPLPG